MRKFLLIRQNMVPGHSWNSIVGWNSNVLKLLQCFTWLKKMHYLSTAGKMWAPSLSVCLMCVCFSLVCLSLSLTWERVSYTHLTHTHTRAPDREKDSFSLSNMCASLSLSNVCVCVCVRCVHVHVWLHVNSWMRVCMQRIFICIDSWEDLSSKSFFF